jgi:hypothetical protein
MDGRSGGDPESGRAGGSETARVTGRLTQANALFRKNLTFQVLESTHSSLYSHCRLLVLSVVLKISLDAEVW